MNVVVWKWLWDKLVIEKFILSFLVFYLEMVGYNLFIFNIIYVLLFLKYGLVLVCIDFNILCVFDCS